MRFATLLKTAPFAWTCLHEPFQESLASEPGDEMFDAQVTADAKQHALKEYPNESVGAVYDGKYVALQNVAPEPKSSFRLERYPVGASAIIHSHTQTLSLAPTYEDMLSQQADETQRVWGILSCNGRVCKGVEWFGDAAPIAPYVGRNFLSGQRDCWCLIRDIYRKEFGINTLPNLPRGENWFRGHTPPDLLSLKNIQEAGFKRISMHEMRPWDIVLGSIGSKVTNHCAIYLGHNLVLHHLEDALSTRALINPWVKRLRYCLRHVELNAQELPDPKEVLK